MGPLAAEVSKQCSNRWQFHLACPCLHGLAVLQPLASPRAALHVHVCVNMPGLNNTKHYGHLGKYAAQARRQLQESSKLSVADLL
jgi:hypothetical protein